MSAPDVEFNDANSANTPPAFSTSKKGLPAYLVTHGVVQNERQASVLLLLLMLIIFGIAGSVVWKTSRGVAPLTPEQQAQFEQMNRVRPPPAQ